MLFGYVVFGTIPGALLHTRSGFLFGFSTRTRSVDIGLGFVFWIVHSPSPETCTYCVVATDAQLQPRSNYRYSSCPLNQKNSLDSLPISESGVKVRISCKSALSLHPKHVSSISPLVWSSQLGKSGRCRCRGESMQGPPMMQQFFQSCSHSSTNPGAAG